MWYRKQQDKKKFKKYKKIANVYWQGSDGFYHYLDFEKNSILDYGNPEIKRFVKRLARRKERNTLKKLDGYMNGSQIHKITGKIYFPEYV